MFLLLWIGTLVLNVIFQIQSFPSLWKVLPFHFLALKLTISMFIFLITLRLLKGIHLSQRGSFYSASAMIFIILDLLILISIDIAFSYYILPVLIFTFAFTIFKNRWLKFIFLILSIIVLLGGVLNIFILGAERVIHLILLSPVSGNLIISATLIPVALMIFRLQFLFHQNKKRRAKYVTIGSDILLGFISTVLFVYLALFNPYEKGILQAITITEKVSIANNTRDLLFSSSEPLGEIIFSTAYGNKLINTSEKKYSIPNKGFESSPELLLSKKSFLNRTQYKISINSPFKPDHISAVLAGEEAIFLFDSNFNVYPIDENETEFLIEANPQLPVEILFTVSPLFHGDMTILINYSDYPQMIRLDSNHFSVTHNIIFEKKISIGK